MKPTKSVNTDCADVKDKDIEWYKQLLYGEECLCEREKKAGKSFCYRCYRQLPADMQRALYQSIYDGYDEAFEEAVKWLQENIW